MLNEAILTDIRDLIENEKPRSLAALDWASYSGKVPEALIAIWKESGAALWSNGSYQTIDPADFMSATCAALRQSSITEQKAIPYLLSAFGRITAWHPDYGIITIDPVYGRNIIAKNPFKRGKLDRNDIEILTGFPIFSADEFNRKFFDAAVAKLGAIARNEVFGFVPALSLGGRASIRYLERLTAEVHLDILSQSVDFQTFYVDGNMPDYKLVPI